MRNISIDYTSGLCKPFKGDTIYNFILSVPCNLGNVLSIPLLEALTNEPSEGTVDVAFTQYLTKYRNEQKRDYRGYSVNNSLHLKVRFFSYCSHSLRTCFRPF